MIANFRRAVLGALTVTLWPLAAASLPTGKPEDVGLSSERLQRIHDMVMRHVAAHDISGAVTIVARRGRIAYFEAHGLMDIASGRPMAKDALFRLASTTKPVTATAVLILLEEGKLLLTDPVAKYIPEFKVLKVAVPNPPGSAERYSTTAADRDITILDLLTHTSGLASSGITTPDFARLVNARKPAESLADYIPRLGSLPLDFQPGTKWRYSGLAGFETLGRIVEIASGMPFDRFLKQRIFEPLGMNDTMFAIPEKEAGRLVTVYRRAADGLHPPDRPLPLGSATYFSGAAGLTSTAEDYAKFAVMLANGGQLNGKRILSPWTVDLMMSNHVEEMFGGQLGRPPKGVGFGLGGEVILNAVDGRLRRPNGSYGWDGAFGTHWWANRREQMAAVFFIQTPGRAIHLDFDNAVSQAVIE